MDSKYSATGLSGPGRELARVSAVHGERLHVLLQGREVAALLAGTLQFQAASAADLPVTGDQVWVRPVAPDTVLIEAVLPRRSRIARRAAGRRDQEQILAANVDLALIVCGLDADFNLARLERYVAICRAGRVEPVAVLNKADTQPEAAVDRLRDSVPCDRVLTVSARTGQGCESVAALLPPGVTAVLLGSSGAGKSTLLNRLLAGDLRKTAPVRDSDGRGRHTTTAREWIELPNGAAVIDTPGLREIQLWLDRTAVDAAFDDIAQAAAGCRFRDCTHTVEPGCAVRASVDARRLDNFQKLRREAERAEGAMSEKQRWRSIHKAARQFQKLRDRQRSE